MDASSALPKLGTGVGAGAGNRIGWPWSWRTWLAIVLVLALFGINVFHYLSTATEESAGLLQKVFGPILKLFGYVTLTTAKEVVDNTATGTKAAISAVQDTVVDGIDKVVSGSGDDTSDLKKALMERKGDNTNTITGGVAPAETGWCFIGSDRLVRSCIEVGANDTCMSGSIFPTQDVCVNPSLRA